MKRQSIALNEIAEWHNVMHAARLAARGKRNPVLNSPTLARLARDYGVSVPQLVLRWALQEGIGVIPKSNRPEHIRENIDILDFYMAPKT